jgi:hypothetical protein
MFDMLLGINIVIPPDVQKVKIRADFEWCTPEQRVKTNTWLAAVFGYQLPLLKDGQVVHDEINKVFYMNKQTYQQVTSTAIKSGNTRI